jgi:hypothetical protein
MRKNPERLAWVILLMAFTVFAGVVTGVPLGVRAYLLSGRRDQNVSLEVQRGTLRVMAAGRGAPIAIAERYDGVSARTVVTTDLAQGRLVCQAPQEDAPVVASVQIYDNTEVTLTSALSPRFAISLLPHEVMLQVESGRVRINVINTEDRLTVADVVTPHGNIQLKEGSYEVKVNATTEISVRNGQADIHSSDAIMTLEPLERAIIGGALINGPLPATRNLVKNGDFQAGLDGWTTYGEQTDPEQPLGEIGIVTNEGREVAQFVRVGTNHSEIGIRQDIVYDVRDFSSVELHLAVRIIEESIAGFGGCGYLGSECPIIVRLEYRDVQGSDRTWQHGFYIGEPASDWLTHSWAEQVQQGNWQSYDSGNLMEELADAPPALIRRLTIYASGHSFDVMVTEIEVSAQE